jgi:putative membrane protein
MTRTANFSPPKRTFQDYLLVTLRGMCMGAADVVPGVSGGTMAFILGIYDELIHAVHALNWTFLRRLLGLQWRAAFAGFPWRFLLALGLGILLAVFTLAEGLSWALHHHPTLVWAFFFGLVLASIVLVRRRVRHWTAGRAVAAALAAALLFWLIGVAPVETPDAPWFLFLSGFTAVCAMILPGISGAFILVLLGKYQDVLDALITFDLFTLGVFAAGAAAGLIGFVRVLRFLLMRRHDGTVAVLMGMMIGSLRKVWPWKAQVTAAAGQEAAVPHEMPALPPEFTLEAGMAAGLMLAGMGTIALVNYLAERKAQHDGVSAPE